MSASTPPPGRWFRAVVRTSGIAVAVVPALVAMGAFRDLFPSNDLSGLETATIVLVGLLVGWLALGVVRNLAAAVEYRRGEHGRDDVGRP